MEGKEFRRYCLKQGLESFLEKKDCFTECVKYMIESEDLIGLEKCKHCDDSWLCQIFVMNLIEYGAHCIDTSVWKVP